METFAEARELTENPHFAKQRREMLATLSDDHIDSPIVELVRDFNALPFCFTLQCCHGHFVYEGQSDPRNRAPLPLSAPVGKVEYRIAYVAMCLDNSAAGKYFLSRLAQVPVMDPDYVQFGSAGWFWERQVNTYALQVEPDRFKDKDSVTLDYREARHVEAVRNAFFMRLKDILAAPVKGSGTGTVSLSETGLS